MDPQTQLIPKVFLLMLIKMNSSMLLEFIQVH